MLVLARALPRHGPGRLLDVDGAHQPRPLQIVGQPRRLQVDLENEEQICDNLSIDKAGRMNR